VSLPPVARALWIGTAACLLVLTVGPGAPRRARASDAVSADVALAAIPTASVDVVAAPDVTTPAASVARFSVLPLPLVATVVVPRVAHEIGLARFGGLYGP